MLHAETGVLHIASLLSEDTAEEALFWSELSFTLWSNFTDENVAWANFCTDADDTFLCEVLELGFANVRDVTSCDFWTELGVADIHDEFFDMDGAPLGVLDDALRKDDGVLIVVARPRHEGDESVMAESDLAIVGSRCVSEDSTLLDLVTDRDDRALMEGRKAVGALEQDGKYKTLPVITGQDGELLSAKWIMEGKQTMTVFKDTRVLAKGTAQAVDSIVKGAEPALTVKARVDTTTYNTGKKVVKSFLLEPVAVTKDNLTKELVDSGFYTADAVAKGTK